MVITKTKKNKSQKRINKKLDLAWSKAVKRVANYKCEVCGVNKTLNSHHIVGRRNFALRWELRNGACLCAKCHKFGTQSAHLDPIWFDKWLRENRKQDYEFLQEPKNKDIKKWTIWDKEAQLEYLTLIADSPCSNKSKF